MPRINFLKIVNYLEYLALQHKEINGSYRWNASEFTGKLRKGSALPVMLIDSIETQTSGNNTKTIHSHSTAFTVLGKGNKNTGSLDAYDLQNEVLDHCQQICFDIETRILDDASKMLDTDGNKNWLYGMIDKNSFHHFKVGPIFSDSLYGYRCEVIFKNQVPPCPDNSKWNDL